jgi:hypothetical protein
LGLRKATLRFEVVAESVEAAAASPIFVVKTRSRKHILILCKTCAFSYTVLNVDLRMMRVFLYIGREVCAFPMICVLEHSHPLNKSTRSL